jgi:uncharacterized protein (PEP-CTERM system associated)
VAARQQGTWFLCVASLCTGVQAQDVEAPALDTTRTASGTASSIVPSFRVQETVTSNRDLSATQPKSDAITQVSPGVRVSSRGGRVQGSLSYSLNVLMHAREPHRTTTQNALNAALKAEAVPNLAYLDASATVSQNTVSAFGTQSQGTGLVNANSTEVATASVSPSLRGKLGGFADVSARLNWTASHSASTSAGDSRSHGGDLGIGGRQGLFGWGLNASRQINDSKAASKTTQDQTGASLSFFPDPELQLSAQGGTQTNDVLTGTRQSYTTTGWGAQWRPTDRTDVNLQGGRSYAGHTHSLSLRHRMARSVWSYIDSRGVTGDSGTLTSVQPLTLYDLLYTVCLRQGGDPVTCDQSVRLEIARQGLNPDAVVGGFLGSALALQRTQNVAVSISGLRTTITLNGFRTETSRLGQTSISSGDLSLVDSVRQLGHSFGVSHRLTPSASIALNATRLRTLNSGALPGTEQRLVSLSLLGSLGPHTSGSISARRTLFVSPTAPYNESALVGSLSLSF